MSTIIIYIHQQMSGHDIHRLQIVSKGSLLYNNHTGVRSAKITCLNPVMIFKFISLKLLKDRTEDNFFGSTPTFYQIMRKPHRFRKETRHKTYTEGTLPKRDQSLHVESNTFWLWMWQHRHVLDYILKICCHRKGRWLPQFHGSISSKIIQSDSKKS